MHDAGGLDRGHGNFQSNQEDVDARHGWKWHDTHGRDPHERHEHDADHDHRHDRGDLDFTIDGQGDLTELELEVDQHGKHVTIDVEIDTAFGSFDLRLNTNACLLQPDNTPLTALIAGEGNAVGNDTLVDADIFSRLMDLGRVTVAWGSADFTSAAVSTSDLAFAAADTFADVSGADFVFSFEEKLSVTGSLQDSQFAEEQSKTTFVAIDFEDFDLPGGPLIVSASEVRYLDGDRSPGCDGSASVDIDGNVAQLNIDAVAQGENTLADSAASVLTIEDQLSSISALAIISAA
jgi:hypothetical protein